MADRAEFDRLAEQWEREIAHLSSTSAMMIRHTFRYILQIGSDAIPWAFERLRDNVFWHLVLERLVFDPPETKVHGDMGRLQAIWLRWGEQHGYVKAATVGNPHAEATQSLYEQGLAELIRQVQGAVAMLAHKLAGDTVPMEGICDLLMKVARNELPPNDPSIATEVERLVRN